jgi:hypothetical protein
MSCKEAQVPKIGNGVAIYWFSTRDTLTDPTDIKLLSEI